MNTTDKPVCRPRRLASDGLCAVEYCAGCRAFHVRVGYTILNLNPEAFAALCGTTAAAMARFRGQTAPAAHEHPTEETDCPRQSLH
jgi:hypothetical protein